MCLALPGKIVETREGSSFGRLATVDFHGNRIETSLVMTPSAQVGDWVLVHAGFTISVLEEKEAMETFAALRSALGENEPEKKGAEENE